MSSKMPRAPRPCWVIPAMKEEEMASICQDKEVGERAVYFEFDQVSRANVKQGDCVVVTVMMKKDGQDVCEYALPAIVVMGREEGAVLTP